MTPFRAMFKKELRENLKWAVLILLVNVVAMGYGLQIHSLDYGYEGPISVGIASDRFLTVNLFASMVAGFALGFLQIILESRPDSFAFLVHRPVPRATLFYAKVTAGLTLYFSAMLVPFFLATLYSAMPGHYPAPFDIRMTTPGLIDVLTGTLYYFAGMLIALRDARWYASRGLPLAVCILASFVAVEGPTLWFPVGAITVGFVVLAPAAFQAFQYAQTLEPFVQRSRLGRAATALTLFIGVSVLTGAVAGILASLFESPHPPASHSQRLEITKAGEPILLKSEDGTIRSISDLQGHPIHWPTQGRITNRDIQNRTLSATAVFSIPSQSLFRSFSSYRSTDRFYFATRTNRSSVFWYLSNTERRFLKFDRKTRLFVGSLGPDGYIPGPIPPSAGRFLESLNIDNDYIGSSGTLLHVSSTQVYGVRLDDQTATLLFSADPGNPLVEGRTIFDPAQDSSFFPLVISAQKNIFVLTANGAVARLPNPLEGMRYGELRYLPGPTNASDRFFLRIIPLFPAATSDPLIEYASDGRIMRKIAIPPPPAALQIVDHSGLITLPLAPFWLLPAGDAIARYSAPWSYDDSVAPKDPVGDMLADVLPFLSALVSCVAAFYIGRWRFLPRRTTLFWTITTFLFGPIGLLTFLSLHSFPTRVICPACHKRRPITETACPHCRQPFPAPPTDGTEIFNSFAIPADSTSLQPNATT